MLKKFAILLCCGFLTISTQAQDFGGGVILGLSTSQVGGDDLGGFNKAGLLAGIFANKLISPLLSFQMEMTFIQKGSNNPKMNTPEHENYLKPDIFLSYIEIPLLLQYHQSKELSIEGGLLSAYLIDGYYNDMSGEMTNETNPFINYEVGLLLGLDYNYSENISLNTRICNSVLPIGSEDYSHLTTYNSNKKGKKNSVLSFAFHYNF